MNFRIFVFYITFLFGWLEIENKVSQEAITLEEVVFDEGPETDELDKFLRE